MNHTTIKALLQEAMRDLDLGNLERAARGCDYCAGQLRQLDHLRNSAMLAPFTAARPTTPGTGDGE
jgi:hypothetical protein